MGRGYVIEHCISTLNTIRKEDVYKSYLTEVLREIAKHVGVEITISYHELIKSMMQPQKEETRTADEVIDDIKEKLQKIRGDTVESA